MLKLPTSTSLWVNTTCLLLPSEGSDSHFSDMRIHPTPSCRHTSSRVSRGAAIVQRAFVGLGRLCVHVVCQRSPVNPRQTLPDPPPHIQPHAEVQQRVHTAVEVGDALRHRVPYLHHLVLTVHHFHQQEAVVRCPAHEERND